MTAKALQKNIQKSVLQQEIFSFTLSRKNVGQIHSNLLISLVILHYQSREKKQANLYVVLFPMGWSFLERIIIGKQHPYYAMGPDAVITTLGILPALKRDLPDANVLEVENLLKEQNLSTENDLYFSVDGHWTPKAQKIIGDYLGQLLSQKT